MASPARRPACLADRFGYGVVFLIGGLAATLGFAMVVAIARTDRAQTA